MSWAEETMEQYRKVFHARLGPLPPIKVPPNPEEEAARKARLDRTTLHQNVIRGILKVVLHRLIYSWVQRLQLDRKRGIAWPGVDLLCDQMTREAREAHTRMKELEHAMWQLAGSAQDAGTQILLDTLTGLTERLMVEFAQFEKTLALAGGKGTAPASDVRMAIALNERLVLHVSLEAVKTVLTTKEKFQVDAVFTELATHLKALKVNSEQRMTSLQAIAGAGANRQSIQNYYVSLIHEIMENPSQALKQIRPGWWPFDGIGTTP
ncbi:MAG: hypothetical protein JST93_11460 [Acidobacteria bacterium]|nr:hypothetical protein [Acidobacteriota bacterium]